MGTENPRIAGITTWVSATAARICLDIFLSGSQKVQEIDPLIFAGLGYA